MMLLVFLFTILYNGAEISQGNQLKSEAMELIKQGNYADAEKKLSFLRDSLKQHSPEITLNLASAQFNQGKNQEAFQNYREISSVKNHKISSQAFQQMGVIKYKEQKLEESLAAFRESILKDPQNKESRFNYELVKKKLDQQKNQNQDQENQDQKDKQEKDQQNQKDQKKEQQQDQQEQQDQEKEENQEKNQEKDQEGEENDQKESQQEPSDEKKEGEEKKENEEVNPEEEKQNPQAKNQPNFEDVKISPEMAKMILQAMENREMQYFQQLKKEPTKSNKSKSKW